MPHDHRNLLTHTAPPPPPPLHPLNWERSEFNPLNWERSEFNPIELGELRVQPLEPGALRFQPLELGALRVQPLEPGALMQLAACSPWLRDGMGAKSVSSWFSLLIRIHMYAPVVKSIVALNVEVIDNAERNCCLLTKPCC